MLRRILTKTQIPLALLILILQRAPQTYSFFLNRLALPSTQIIQKAFLATASLGAAHALSGATVSRYSVNNSNYTIGAQLIIHRETGQEGDPVQIGISNTITPQSWTVQGELPPGLRMTDFLQQAEPVDGIFNASAPYLLGNYTSAGNYVVTLTPWSGLDGTGDNAPKDLTITFQIEEGPPAPATPPQISFERSDNTVTLVWETDAANGYQLTKSSNLESWTPIPSPAPETNGQTRLALNPAPEQTEFYRFEPAQQ